MFHELKLKSYFISKIKKNIFCILFWDGSIKLLLYILKKSYISAGAVVNLVIHFNKEKSFVTLDLHLNEYDLTCG